MMRTYNVALRHAGDNGMTGFGLNATARMPRSLAEGIRAVDNMIYDMLRCGMILIERAPRTEWLGLVIASYEWSADNRISTRWSVSGLASSVNGNATTADGILSELGWTHGTRWDCDQVADKFLASFTDLYDVPILPTALANIRADYA